MQLKPDYFLKTLVEKKLNSGEGLWQELRLHRYSRPSGLLSYNFWGVIFTTIFYMFFIIKKKNLKIYWDTKMLYQHTNPLIPWLINKYFPLIKIIVFGFLKSAELLQIPVNVNKEEIQMKVQNLF